MTKIDFDITEPSFVNGNFKWYVDTYLQNYIENEQANNLPKLKGFGCFIVKSNDVEDYVLIDSKQNVIDAYPYNLSGCESMMAKINIIKISKHYDKYEKLNV